MNRRGAGNGVITALCLCLILAFAKPALLYALEVRKLPQLTLNADFGIPPVKWIPVPVPPVVAPLSSVGIVNGYMKWPSIGLDFRCVELHVRCAGPGRDIYGDKCSAGDPLERKFLYPPLMAYLFIWVKWFTPGVALGLWGLLVLGGSFAAAGILARAFRAQAESNVSTSPMPSPMPAAVQVALCFTLFYPVLFAFERGNNDVWVLWLYAAAVIGWMCEKWWLAGLCVGLAAMVKIYPAALWTGCLAAALAMLATDRKRALGWLGGLGAGVAVVLLPLGRDYHYFLFHHFFSTVGQRPIVRGSGSLDLTQVDPHSIITGSAFDHSLKMSYGPAGFGLGILLGAVVVVVWCALELKKNESTVRKQHALLAFLFLSALCTYLVPGTESFDYNLVTAIPLFVYFVYFRPISVPALLEVGAVLWVLGAALPRWVNEFIFGFPERSFSVLLVLQVVGMCLVATYLVAACFRLNRAPAAPPESPR